MVVVVDVATVVTVGVTAVRGGGGGGDGGGGGGGWRHTSSSSFWRGRAAIVTVVVVAMSRWHLPCTSRCCCTQMRQVTR